MAMWESTIKKQHRNKAKIPSWRKYCYPVFLRRHLRYWMHEISQLTSRFPHSATIA